MVWKLRSRIRASVYTVILNPLFVRAIDWVHPTISLGARGEREAERYLLKQGLIITHRCFRNPIGEIDLVAVDHETVVFVEVKTRMSDLAGSPFEAVDDQKQEKITATATSFLKHYDLTECRTRFDVISIFWPDPRQSAQIEHIEDAFEATGRNC